jgi:hypothetical protein
MRQKNEIKEWGLSLDKISKLEERLVEFYKRFGQLVVNHLVNRTRSRKSRLRQRKGISNV